MLSMINMLKLGLLSLSVFLMAGDCNTGGGDPEANAQIKEGCKTFGSKAEFANKNGYSAACVEILETKDCSEADRKRFTELVSCLDKPIAEQGPCQNDVFQKMDKKCTDLLFSMNEKFNRNAANCKDALALITAAGKTAPEDIKTQLLCEEKADAACDADQAALLRTYIGADPLPAALPADLKDTCLAFVNKIQGALQ